MWLFKSLVEPLGRRSGGRLLVEAIVLVVLLALLDYSTGYELSFSLFYLFPVAIVAWRTGRREVVLIALLSCIGWSLADTFSGHEYAHPAYGMWNAAVRLAFFLICGLLLTALRDAYAAAQALASSDSLTGLYTRRVFEARLTHDIEICRRQADSLTVVYIDLDNFKAINDTAGHAEGDAVLQQVGRILRDSFRRADTAARLGGDEFALILPNTDARGTRELIEKFRANFAANLVRIYPNIGCSIGAVTFARMPNDPVDAVRRADALMYAIKRQGKNRTAFETVAD